MSYSLLLADDSLTIRRVIELTFAEEDVTVTTVGDGRRAMACIQSARPDIVLADGGMSAPGGYEIAAFVKNNKALAGIPVVLLTAAFQPVDEARAQEAGCDAVLQKPFELPLLVSTVMDLLRGVEEPSSDAAVIPAATAPQPAAEPAQEQPTAERLADVDAGAVAAEPPQATVVPEVATVPQAVDSPAAGAALPSLDETFDSIDSGKDLPPPIPGDTSWASDADDRGISLAEYFDRLDAAALATAVVAGPAETDMPAALVQPEPGEAPSAPAEPGVTSDPARETASEPAAADLPPDVVTRTFLTLMRSAAVPYTPELVERAVRQLLAASEGSVESV